MEKVKTSSYFYLEDIEEHNECMILAVYTYVYIHTYIYKHVYNTYIFQVNIFYIGFQ